MPPVDSSGTKLTASGSRAVQKNLQDLDSLLRNAPMPVSGKRRKSVE